MKLRYNSVPIGPLATVGCKPRQARKGAAVAADPCAEVWLVGLLIRSTTGNHELSSVSAKMAT